MSQKEKDEGNGGEKTETEVWKWAEDVTESKEGNPFMWVRFAKIIALMGSAGAMPALMDW